MASRIHLALALALSAAGTTFADEPTDADRLFASSHLVEIRIELPEKDWQALCWQTRNFTDALGKELVPSPFTYFKGNVVVDGKRIEGVGIRKKGFLGSLDEQRPSLKIKFDEYTEQQPFTGLDRLTLNNNKQDGYLASQFLAYQIFDQAGVPAPRCNFAHITVNGENLGIYSHVESIKKPFLTRRFGDASGSLLEGTLADFFGDRVARFESKTDDDQAGRESIQRVADLLATDGELKVEELEKVIELDSFLKYWAVESLINFWDGYNSNQNNFFVYRNPSSSKLHWIPWGADAVFTVAPIFVMLPRSPKSVTANSLLAHRLYGDERTRERYRRTLVSLLETVWKEDEFLGKLDKMKRLVSGHLHERQEKKFEAHLRQARRFIERRRADIMEELEDWPVTVPQKHRTPIHLKPSGMAKGTFSTQWRDDQLANVTGLGEATLELVLGTKPVKLKSLGVSANPSQPGPGETLIPGKPTRPAIIVTGKRESGSKTVTLAIVVSFDDFRPDAKTPVPAQGILFESGGFFGGGFRFISGTVTFEKADRKAGAPVVGSFDVKLRRL